MEKSLLCAQIDFVSPGKTQRRILARRHPASLYGVTHLPFIGSPFTPSLPPSPPSRPASPFLSPSPVTRRLAVTLRSLTFCGGCAPIRRTELRAAPLISRFWHIFQILLFLRKSFTESTQVAGKRYPVQRVIFSQPPQ